MDKIREGRLRNTAARRGLKLRKSRRRDPKAIGFGLWTISTARGKVVAGKHRGLTLDSVEEYLL